MKNSPTTKKHVFIAVAWPYANGSLHLGHVAGLIGADFLARYWRLKNHPVMMVSGSDCHGTPIEVKAEKEKSTPQKIVAFYDKEFRRTLVRGLDFSYDLFSKTANPFHYKLVQQYFLELLKKGYIYEKTQNLPYCEKCQRFLPDRYIEGTCPKCQFSGARGDQCDECGSVLDASDLIEPRCKICGERPIWKETKHFFLKLSQFQKPLLAWVKKSKGWRPNATSFTLKFLGRGLVDRAITRDSAWGIPVPVAGYEGKTIYVWFEAVSGYLTASQELSQKLGKPNLWKKFWQSKNAFHYYVHGKDNIPFHTVIWPAILLGLGGLNLPDRIVSSEYLNFRGKQFSKSRNWGVWLPEFLAKYDPETLRYYLGINGPENADSDFSWEKYQSKVNTELLGKIGNFVNRILSFTEKNFGGKVPFFSQGDKTDRAVIEECKNIFPRVGKLIEEAHFKKALKEILDFTEKGNQYIDQKEPWKSLKKDKKEAGKTIYVCLQSVSALQLLLSPFLPRSAEKIRKQLKVPKRNGWKFVAIKSGHKIGQVAPLFRKIEI